LSFLVLVRRCGAGRVRPSPRERKSSFSSTLLLVLMVRRSHSRLEGADILALLLLVVVRVVRPPKLLPVPAVHFGLGGAVAGEHVHYLPLRTELDIPNSVRKTLEISVAVDRIRDDVAVWIITALYVLENIRSDPAACWDTKETAPAEQIEGGRGSHR